ncbi:MAG TPA: hypothetical protein VJH90_04365 [archaeon]|nr:hypothetical protein [archaeon]
MISKPNARRLLKGLLFLYVLLFAYLAYPVVYYFYIDYGKCTSEYSIGQCVYKFLSYQYYDTLGECYIDKIEQGSVISPRTINIYADFYLVNTNLTNEAIYYMLEGTNDIWNIYNISFISRNIVTISNKSLALPDLSNCSELLSYASLSDEEGYDNVIDVVISDFPSKFFGGIHYPKCNERRTYLTAVSIEEKNISWTIGHEFGHILNLLDKAHYSGELNFMTHGGCIKDNYYPSVLNQAQVNNATSEAMKIANG